MFTNFGEIASVNPYQPTCRRGEGSTKLAAASPSCGGLNYSPLGAVLFTNVDKIATDSR